MDRLLLAARLTAAGVDLSGRLLAEFFLVDFVPLLWADDVVLMAMNMCPFPPNCVEVTRWRRHRFSPGDPVVGAAGPAVRGLRSGLRQCPQHLDDPSRITATRMA